MNKSSKILLFLALLVVFTSAKAPDLQQNLITIKADNATLESVLKKIEIAGKYSMLYNYDDISRFKSVTVNAVNKTIQEVMDAVLKNTGLGYKIKDNTIVISKPVPVKKEQQPVRISGKIFTENGDPLPGVHIRLKSIERGTISDQEGNYSLTVNDINGTLVASFVGYQTKEIPIRGRSVINFQMIEGVNELQELVVSTGYQKLTKRETASAVERIDMEKIELVSKPNIDQMLAGQVPGMMVLQTSGEPGATPTIRIRGTSSIIGTRAPLWVLDGMILEDQVNIDLSSLSSPDAEYLIGNAIAGVNPKDIESITVLKDASATAIYGSRAANGVIVVTTKQGREGKPRISYSGGLSISKRIGYGDLNLMNAGERVKLSQEIIADNIEYSRTPTHLGYEGLLIDYYNHVYSYDQFESEVKKMVDRNTDWYDLLFRNSVSNNHSINVSGGSDRTTYYTSLGYYSSTGTAKGSDQERFSALTKVNSWITPKFYTGFQLNVSSTKSNGFHSSVNPNSYAYETARTIPCYNDDGSYFLYLTQQKSQTAISEAPDEDLKYNIVKELSLTGAKSEVSNITAQLNLQYNFTPAFRYKILGGFDQSVTTKDVWAQEESNYVSMKRGYNAGTLVQGTSDFDESPIPWGGIISKSNQRKNSYSIRNTFEYSNILKKDHLVNIMAASEIRSVKYEGFSGTYYGWQPDRGETISPALTTGYYGVLSSLTPTITDNVVNTVSWIGSATYSYKDKFTLNANLRADGSNNFGENPNFRFLPIWSFAGKYTLSNEQFMKNSKVVDYLAIRASYGVQGNIDKATSPDLIIRVGSRNANTGLYQSYFKYLANPDLRWEKTTSYNFGLDFSFFGPSGERKESIISGTFDFYDKYGDKIIVSRQVSQVIGLDQVKINGGRIRNRGFEGSITIVPYQTKDVSTSFRFVYSVNRNKLLEANKDLSVTDSDKLNGTALVEGQPIGSLYSYEFAGLNETYGFPMFYNSNGDRRYELYNEEMHLVYSGKTTPDISGGFDLNARYKRFYVTFGFQYTLGASARLPNIYRNNYYNVFDPLTNVSKEYIDRWREPGDESHTNIPVIWDADKYSEARSALNAPVYLSSSYKNPLQMYDYSTARIAKTDNLRLRSLNISYLFPEKITTKLGVQSLMINLQAENLFIICDKRWQGRDPESGGSNTPSPKVFSLGLNMTF